MPNQIILNFNDEEWEQLERAAFPDFMGDRENYARYAIARQMEYDGFGGQPETIGESQQVIDWREREGGNAGLRGIAA